MNQCVMLFMKFNLDCYFMDHQDVVRLKFLNPSRKC